MKQSSVQNGKDFAVPAFLSDGDSRDQLKQMLCIKVRDEVFREQRQLFLRSKGSRMALVFGNLG